MPLSAGQQAQREALLRRMIAADGARLKDLRPDLAEMALGTIGWPDVEPGVLKLHSNLSVRWLCQCGKTFLRGVHNAQKATPFVCPICRRVGRSRFEFEVAKLAELLTGTTVILHHSLDGTNEVDLFFPDYDMAVELDPFTSHKGKRLVDIRRQEMYRKVYRSFHRLREHPLDPVPGSITIPHRSAALEWARALAHLVSPEKAREVSDEGVRVAMAAANAEWESALRKPPSNPLAGNAAVVSELVANLTHPGRTPEWTPIGAGDRCLWRCADCQHEWEAAVGHRAKALNPTGCPRCSRVLRGNRWARATEESAASRAPHLVAEFVANLTRPGTTLDHSKPGSGDICRWRCKQCGQEWSASLSNRVRLGSGCRPCSRAAVWEVRRERQIGPDAEQWEANFAVLEAYAASTGSLLVPSTETIDGFRLGQWLIAQRKRRFSMGDYRRNKLESLPRWAWSSADGLWERKLQLTEQFAIREGHLKLSTRKREQGVRIGSWVHRQRSKRSELTAMQVTKLLAVPHWTWE